MSSPHHPKAPSGSFEFDSVAFARIIANARQRANLSTRELARKAGISQAYVVALERARPTGVGPGPTPTVDVLARLAHALAIGPGQLFQQSMRPVGRHVLVVVNNASESIMDSVCALAGSGTDTWLSAGSIGDHHALPVRLRRNQRTHYERNVIKASLQSEMERLAPSIAGERIGLVFTEMSEVMKALRNPEALVEFEHRWAEVVSTAAARVGAHAAWNVCVYETAAVRALADPATAAIELIQSHDTVWSIEHDRVTVGKTGVRRIAELLRPEHVTATAWQTEAKRIVNHGLLAS